MRGRRLAGWVIASLVLGCAPAPSPTPSPTPPPVPVDAVPWPDLIWSMAEGVGSDDPGFGEQAVAVTDGPDGLVAVGYRDREGARDGLAWTSPDGITWSRVVAVDAFEGVELLDVAPAPNGYVALGIGTLGAAQDRPHAAFFTSPDGRSWDRLIDVTGSETTYPTGLTGGPKGVVAIGIDDDSRTVVWRSRDGRSFERDTLDDPAVDSLTDPHALADGYVALGPPDRSPTLLRSTDAVSWAVAPIDDAPATFASRLVPGRWGYIVQGLWDPGCDATAAEPCEQHAIGWWSADGKSWTRLPERDTPIGNGASIVVDAGVHGVIAIDGASAWASPNGWGWQPLPEPSDGSMAVFDAVVTGDVIVAVGANAAEDGSGRTAIAVARAAGR